MMVHTSGRFWASTLLAGFLSLGLIDASGAVKDSKSQKSKSQKSKSTEKSEAVETTTVSYRLPRYFASIIDDEQRSEMQEIQASFHEKIAAIQQELDELEAARMKALEGVLTTSQRKMLTEMRSNAGTAGSGKDKSSPSKASNASSKTSKSKSASSSEATRKSSAGDD